ncbi:hypothetical protein GDO78_021793 [Eleutherodactylus coqui]|uniref:Uncharacterized protein n=1 Tax=Eleutherodactylus coqui TaxID=57060 RepID=A0A8J6BCJ4_ELECQ|nr:hypothetical protein GDO78_021793 [Eleutherodactylus coqui]
MGLSPRTRPMQSSDTLKGWTLPLCAQIRTGTSSRLLLWEGNRRHYFMVTCHRIYETLDLGKLVPFLFFKRSHWCLTIGMERRVINS